MIYRQTLAAPVVCAGVGLHSGERVRLVMQPAPAGAGIVFIRSDITDRDNRVEARADAVTGIRLGTTIANGDGVSVATVEHLMAALAGIGVDDAIIDIDGPELPVMDGSSAPFVELIHNVGLVAHAAPRRAIQVLKPVMVETEGRRAGFLPALKPMIEVDISFEHQAVGRQSCVFDVTPDIFANDIAGARTFGFQKDYDALLAAGLARGGSMDNAVVLDDTGVVNPEGLRYDDEFVRHKALDALGDLYLAGAPILGRYSASRPGHAINNAAVRALLDDTSAWKMVTMRGGATQDIALANS
ncbi:UDP-3-O-acyl-N-acetylglucosamine deacetylase [Maricaulis sp.]|uniref:UDP-3-O-acyl-N-acetylglucosamine deacetylase n=1 Tax=Maricaulis sp. TaxID=1486257 RepID=UPI00261E0271|nr:UDP-3-O-acyl-N-acetylglucosamine deacetylase [Maricaulis sp.]